MAFIIRDQTRALEEACFLVGLSRDRGDPRKVRTYVTEGRADGLGRSRTYYVDVLPPEGEQLVRVYDMVEKKDPRGFVASRYEIEEVPV